MDTHRYGSIGTNRTLDRQTGHWWGTVSLIFHLGDSTATLDVPDMGAKGIPVSVKRVATGQIELGIPSINASYKGVWTGKLITGTFTQHGMSFPMPLNPGVPTLKRPKRLSGLLFMSMLMSRSRMAMLF